MAGSSIFDPLVPAGAYDSFVTEAGPRSAAQRRWEAADGALPALYIGHGAPPLLDDATWMGQLAAWTHSMPKPRAVLIISAHWEAAPLMLSAPAAGTPLVYDFGGFQQRYYTLTYRTPDATAFAAEVAALMPDTAPAHQHPSRGLDHGAWVPLKVMYPLADVPVLQLSIPTSDPLKLLALGARLRPLRESGVLVIGSGFLTHGLPFVTRAMITENAVPGGLPSSTSGLARRCRGGMWRPSLTSGARPGCRTRTRRRTTSCRCSSRSARRRTRPRRYRRSSTGTGWGSRSGLFRSAERR